MYEDTRVSLFGTDSAASKAKSTKPAAKAAAASGDKKTAKRKARDASDGDSDGGDGSDGESDTNAKPNQKKIKKSAAAAAAPAKSKAKADSKQAKRKANRSDSESGGDASGGESGDDSKNGKTKKSKPDATPPPANGKPATAAAPATLKTCRLPADVMKLITTFVIPDESLLAWTHTARAMHQMPKPEVWRAAYKARGWSPLELQSDVGLSADSEADGSASDGDGDSDGDDYYQAERDRLKKLSDKSKSAKERRLEAEVNAFVTRTTERRMKFVADLNAAELSARGGAASGTIDPERVWSLTSRDWRIEFLRSHQTANRMRCDFEVLKRKWCTDAVARRMAEVPRPARDNKSSLSIPVQAAARGVPKCGFLPPLTETELRGFELSLAKGATPEAMKAAYDRWRHNPTGVLYAAAAAVTREEETKFELFRLPNELRELYKLANGAGGYMPSSSLVQSIRPLKELEWGNVLSEMSTHMGDIKTEPRRLKRNDDGAGWLLPLGGDWSDSYMEVIFVSIVTGLVYVYLADFGVTHTIGTVSEWLHREAHYRPVPVHRSFELLKDPDTRPPPPKDDDDGPESIWDFETLFGAGKLTDSEWSQYVQFKRIGGERGLGWMNEACEAKCRAAGFGPPKPEPASNS